MKTGHTTTPPLRNRQRTPWLRRLVAALWVAVAAGIVYYFVFLYPGTRPASGPETVSADARPWRKSLAVPDTLTAVTLTGSTTYFTYRDQELGYQYELLSLWTEEVGIPLRIMPVQSVSAMLDSLICGRADIAITPQPEVLVDSLPVVQVGPLWEDYQVLAQYKGGHGSGIIESTVDLVGHTLAAIENTPAALRLQHIREELLGAVQVHLLPDSITQEELIDSVASGSIPYAVADYAMVRYLNSYYGTLDYHLPLSTPQAARWTARDSLRGLTDSLRLWADTLDLDTRYKQIHKRYFEYSKEPGGGEEAPGGRPSERRRGKISDYDYLFQKYARQIGWDWHLLASIARQESHFRPEVVGMGGATGLMGIMPATGRRHGYSRQELKNAEVSVRVAAKTLAAFGRQFSHIADPEQRVKFTLASYNAGSAHVQDACRLAAKHGDNPDVWDNSVELYMRRLSDPKYYNDPVVRSGYARGVHTVRYVRQVCDRARQYRSE